MPWPNPDLRNRNISYGTLIRAVITPARTPIYLSWPLILHVNLQPSAVVRCRVRWVLSAVPVVHKALVPCNL